MLRSLLCASPPLPDDVRREKELKKRRRESKPKGMRRSRGDEMGIVGSPIYDSRHSITVSPPPPASIDVVNEQGRIESLPLSRPKDEESEDGGLMRRMSTRVKRASIGLTMSGSGIKRRSSLGIEGGSLPPREEDKPLPPSRRTSMTMSPHRPPSRTSLSNLQHSATISSSSPSKPRGPRPASYTLSSRQSSEFVEQSTDRRKASISSMASTHEGSTSGHGLSRTISGGVRRKPVPPIPADSVLTGAGGRTLDTVEAGGTIYQAPPSKAAIPDFDGSEVEGVKPKKELVPLLDIPEGPIRETGEGGPGMLVTHTTKARWDGAMEEVAAALRAR